MKKPFLNFAISTSLLLAAPLANAELPQLTEKPWLGCFLVIKDRKAQFVMTAKGDMELFPLKRSGEVVSLHGPVKVHYEILETAPDGKVVSRQVKEETLSTEAAATADPDGPIMFTGKVTGDAAFAVIVAPERGGYSITGKITDKGTLTGSLQFVVTMDWTPYKDGKVGDGDDAEEKFQDKVKRDQLKIETIGGKREKIEFMDKVNPSQLYPDGFLESELKTEGYDGVDFKLEAIGQSKIVFEDKGEKEFWSGFSTRWSVNESGDAGQAKLIVTAG